MATKRCRGCQKSKSFDGYYKKSNLNGKIYYDGLCKLCRNKLKSARQREEYVPKPRTNLPWEIISSPLDELGYPLWPLGGRFSAFDVTLTLKFGYWSPGLVFHNVKRGCDYTVVETEGVQELVLC